MTASDLTTLAVVKQWLNLSSATDDALLTRLISAASDFIQTWLNRTIAQAVYTECRDGTGGQHLMLTHYPATAVTSVRIDGMDVPPSSGPLVPGYVFSASRVSLRGSYVFTAGAGNVQIVYTAGFAETPSAIEQACVELVSLRYSERDRIGVVSKGLAGEAVTFQQSEMTEAIRATLQNYRRVVML